MLRQAFVLSGLSASASSASSALPLLACSFATRKKDLPEVLSEKVSVASKRKKPAKEPKETAVQASKVRVKRALSAYVYFVKEQIPLLEDKTIPITERFKSVSQLWTNMSEQERAPYIKLSEADKAEKAALRAERKTNRPPINAYAQFISELIPTLKQTYPEWGAPEMMRHAANAWRSVSDAEKARRSEQYKEAMAVFKAQQAEEKLLNTPQE